MGRGRNPESAQAKVIKGTFRNDRHSHGPQVPMGAPECPTWLPASAKKYWGQIAPELEKAGLIGLLDEAAFAAHCDSVGRFKDVTAKMKSIEKTLDETPSGYQVQSALFTIRNKLWEQIMKSSQEFGLTPAGRSKVGSGGQQSLPLDNPFHGNGKGAKPSAD